MVTFVAVGTFFIAASPSVALWLAMLQRRAHLLVVSILAAFTWILALILSGAIWFAIPPLKQRYPWVLFTTVLFQELARFVLFLSFRFVARLGDGDGVEAFLRRGTKNEVLSGLAVGVGFALMSVLVNFYSVLADEFSDDTAIYTDTCPINFFVAAASYSLAFSLLHIALGAFVWPAYADSSGWAKVITAFVIHLSIAEATLANRNSDGCVWGIGLVFGLVLLAIVFIFLSSRKRLKSEMD